MIQSTGSRVVYSTADETQKILILAFACHKNPVDFNENSLLLVGPGRDDLKQSGSKNHGKE
jgi:hypothetical protein